MKHQRTSHQQGSLTIEKRSKGPSVWIYRWREVGANGSQVRRNWRVGTKAEFPTRAMALRAVSGLQLDINAYRAGAAPTAMTLDQVIGHYKLTELSDASSKTTRTKEVYTHQLDHVISPQWGAHGLRDVKAVAVEAWLKSMPLAAGTKNKTKGVLSVLFQHAMRYEWASTNPIKLVRQSSLPAQDKVVFTPIEIKALLQELHDPFRTLILLASITGLRRGELFGLKWEDINFDRAELNVVRSMVDQVEGPPKTLASRRPIPVATILVSALQGWRKATEFAQDNDWIFASPLSLGQKPYWPDAVLKRHVNPAAQRAGIVKKIGWHTFRHTVATLLQSSGATMKTTQELMRHASPQITMGRTPRPSQGTNARRRTIWQRCLSTKLSCDQPPKPQSTYYWTFVDLDIGPMDPDRSSNLLKVNGRDD